MRDRLRFEFEPFTGISLLIYGFTSLKRGDKVTFIQGSEAGVFKVQKGAILRRFKINDKGAVVPF